MTTLPVMRVAPPWLAAARDAWLPRESAPLRVTAHMASPTSFEAGEGLRLEGVLSWVVVTLTTGLPPREAFEGVGLADYVDIPVPVCDEVMHGWRIAQCSDAQLAPVAVEVVRKRRKKPHPEALGLHKVQTTGGPWKALDIPTVAWSSPTLTWWLLGDEARLRRLLAECHAVGRARSGGLGQVVAWEVERDESARERWRERALPVPDTGDVSAWPDRDVRVAALRVPCWHRAVKALAACPVVAC